MSVSGVVDDLIALKNLAAQEDDAARRASLDSVRRHVVERDGGAKIAEAASLLQISPPTVRAWIEADVLTTLPGSKPVRVDVASLAAAKQVVDELRLHSQDRHLLADVSRILRDRAALSGEDARSGVDDVAAGRVRRLDQRALDELLPAKGRRRST